MPPDQRLVALYAAEAQQRLRPLDVAFARFIGAAALDACRLLGNVGDQRPHALGIGAEGVGGGGDLGLQCGQFVPHTS